MVHNWPTREGLHLACPLLTQMTYVVLVKFKHKKMCQSLGTITHFMVKVGYVSLHSASISTPFKHFCTLEFTSHYIKWSNHLRATTTVSTTTTFSSASLPKAKGCKFCVNKVLITDKLGMRAHWICMLGLYVAEQCFIFIAFYQDRWSSSDLDAAGGHLLTEITRCQSDIRPSPVKRLLYFITSCGVMRLSTAECFHSQDQVLC